MGIVQNRQPVLQGRSETKERLRKVLCQDCDTKYQWSSTEEEDEEEEEVQG